MISVTNPSIREGLARATSSFSADNLRRFTVVGASGIVGMAIARLSKAAVAYGMAKVAPAAMLENVAIAQAVGGLGAVLGVRFVTGAITDSGDVRDGMTVGALIDAIRPATNFVIKKIIPEGSTGTMATVRSAMLGSFYMRPMGSEPATRTLAGYSPDDFGASVSPDYPSMASLGAVKPKYSNQSQYNTGRLGLYQPGIH